MDTLVLSQAYEPVARCTWKRALGLILKGRAEMVEEYEDWTIHLVTVEFKVPSIIRLLRAIARKRAIKFSRTNVYARDKGTCQYCRLKVSSQDATYDHVIPRKQGGKTEWTNVVICCTPCNQRKGGRTPAQAGMHLLSLPVRPKTLPDTFRLTFLFHKDAPASWAQFARDFGYWNSELVRD